MAKENRKRIIAVDYGTKRIGLAKTDPLQLFAQPVGTFSEEALFRAIREISSLDGIGHILIGYPLNADGSHNRMTDIVDAFAARMHNEFPDIPLKLVNEHGSSRSAGQILIDSGLSRKKRHEKGRLDSASACVLLQAHLDKSH